MKRKWLNIILGWLYDPALWQHPWPWPWSFKVRVWNRKYQEWGGGLTMNEKDVSYPFMSMILTCVTMLGLADVQDSDRGDFGRRRAVDISSFIQFIITNFVVTVVIDVIIIILVIISFVMIIINIVLIMSLYTAVIIIVILYQMVCYAVLLWS